MNENSFSIRLDLKSSWCNNWPEISVDINDQQCWHGFVEDYQQIDLTFVPRSNNTVCINYLNKQNGPDVWDTKLEDGKIIQDQHAILVDILINRANCNWLIPNLPYHYLNGTTTLNRGFMDLKGHYRIDFPNDIYPWIMNQRQELIPKVSFESSLSYQGIYVPDSHNVQAQEIVNNIKVLLEKLND